MADIEVARKALLARLLEGDGKAPKDLQRAAFDLRGLPAAMASLLEKVARLTVDGTVDRNDMRELLAAGVSRAQMEDALAVAFAFHVTTRLADAFDFAIPGPSAFGAGAKYLLARGCK